MLKNYTECIVRDVYKTILEDYPDFCNCEHCELDVICSSLNSLPALYSTTSVGEAYSKLSEYDPQFKVNAMRVVVQSIEKVMKNPRH